MCPCSALKTFGAIDRQLLERKKREKISSFHVRPTLVMCSTGPALFVSLAGSGDVGSGLAGD